MMYIYNKHFNPFNINIDQKILQIPDINDCEEWVDFCNNHDFVKEQLFEFAGLNEHIVKYYLLTANDDDIIYEYDENAETVKPFGTLFDFLKYYRKWSPCDIKGNERPEIFKILTTGRLL